ncbi:hypothetical protein EMIHUDRAFT_459289 [Emiliania huxleyi CCMP1516]|uniref:MIT domain-containing protein n=2 Tax=Emiliania huxleyi TaxID=2903 RepID=A0A0D3IWD8_EMIH1|nr:hypothetical protein EMIHUDRAFT_459289 [Emiliania huxleyi CCMP1516]EOD15573.1 hypothetical protein EMIHUDRAFT_459289 [Emiliania huxleyi CCMP1516]|eukprot:XP_005768002.1 hypothetical protein EMIHUDRAFT_459289 [Emiliania huxleyi CCMP1516]
MAASPEILLFAPPADTGVFVFVVTLPCLAGDGKRTGSRCTVLLDLRDKGIEIANDAVRDDNAGNYEDAINKYCKAAEYLMTATKYEKNPVTLKTIREKSLEYVQRAEALKQGLAGKGAGGKKAGGGGGSKEEEEESEDDDVEPEPLTEEQLAKAEAEMKEELSKLIGMESVKKQMEQLCKQLSLDIRRRAEGHNTLDAIRHMMFTGNPGVGKTTVSRLVARLYHQGDERDGAEVGHLRLCGLQEGDGRVRAVQRRPRVAHQVPLPL